MSGFGPTGGPNPFEGIFGELARLLGGASTGPLNWDVARQVAVLLAGQGTGETNVDPIERIRLEELVRVAELHVGQVTGWTPVIRSVDAVSHVEWASRTLDHWRPLLEDLAKGLSKDQSSTDLPAGGGMENEEALMASFAEMGKLLSPMLLGMQMGGMVGHLSRRSLGQYDLPIPRPVADVVMLVPSNIAAFADDWTLPVDELSLYVAVEEVTRTGILARPHVSKRLQELLSAYVSAFEADTSAIETSLGEFDVTDPSGLPSILNDPSALLGAISTPEQRIVLAQLSALVSALVGYVDYVAGQVSTRTISSANSIAEAAKRRRVEESDGQRLGEKLLGMELAQSTFDRGDAFIHGILERAGEAGLQRLWQSANELPTPAELDAPGLWLARIDLDAD